VKVRINGYEVEGTPEEIRQLLGAPQTNPYLAPYVQPWQPWQPNVPGSPYVPSTPYCPAVYTSCATSAAGSGLALEIPAHLIRN
jgi:hypothetical protein